MTFTKLVVALALAATATTAALAEEKKLTGAEIKAAFTNAKMSYKNEQGTFLFLYKADGAMTGKGITFTWKDEGKWWVKGDRICRKWNYSAGGKEGCFGVTVAGKVFKWWQPDGSQLNPGSTLTATK